MSKKQFGQSTSAVREGHTINVDSLETYLLQAIPELSSPLEVRQFTLGQSNPTYLLKDGSGQQYVLRKKPPGSLLSKTAHAIEREYRILRALNDHTDIPVPKVYVLCEDAHVIGTPFYVMEFLQGRIFSDIRMLDLPFEERRQCWLSAVSTLGKLHSVNFKSIGLEGYGKDVGFFSRQMISLRKVSDSQAEVKDEKTGKKVGPIPRLNDLYAWFKRNEVEDKATIVHGDFKIDNLVFHPTESRVIGILDWELSTIGHPLSDLANLLLPFYIPSVPGVGGLKGLEELPISGPDELMQCYCTQTKTPYPIHNWMFNIAFAFFRTSVILQGVASRIARNQASSTQAKFYAEMFKPIAVMALEIVDEGDIRTAFSKL